jgi:hypothetical protein
MQPTAQAMGKVSHSRKPRLGRKNLVAPSVSWLDLALPLRYYIAIDVSFLTIGPIWEKEPLTPYSGIFYA